MATATITYMPCPVWVAAISEQVELWFELRQALEEAR